MKNLKMLGNVSCSTAIGRFSEKEDEHITHPFYFDKCLGGVLLAVMDGYNGKMIAKLCKESIPKLFNPTDFSDIKNALKKTIRGLNMLANKTGHRGYSSGSCISIVCIPRSFKHVHVAVLGNVRVIILDRYENIHVSPEHNVYTDKEERSMAIKRGGIYDRNKIQIPQNIAHDKIPKYRQVSRAIGDIQMGNIINHEPLLYSVPIGPKSVVIIASNGVSYPTHKDNYVKTLESIVKGVILRENSDDLIRRSEIIANQNLHHDTTIIVWRGPKSEDINQYDKIALC